ncbi:galactokinase [Thermospira aquatica]|uniref:Galactokinase n=1 Tax=Thermospira aquatica TaxID=2828656 RepID=A0AAX3BA27_9SPIR|nr:galactokinase [Thermospira aquatica]URA09079.1 galactokinase [Thermospira aquatica]
MAELRWNPLLKTWVMVASHRQNRPNLPKDKCPFCPGSGKVPDQFDVISINNDFPVMMPQPPEPDPVATEFYQTMPSYGKCEVILYCSQHSITLQELSVEHIQKLVKLWKNRFLEIRKDTHVKYVFPFENKGEEVGATIAHPHGQIYGYPFIPLKLETEYAASQQYYEKHGQCLICKITEEEKQNSLRIIHENNSMIAYIPFFTDYPWGVFVVSKRHFSHIDQMTEEEERDLAETLKVVVGAFDSLFDRPFPYMMVMHQGPVNHELEAPSHTFFHWHLEFYPPLRDRNKIKFYASSEMGAWAAANVMAVEQFARQLFEARLKFLATWDEEKALEEVTTIFHQRYGKENAPIHIYKSPARVNLIGEHIDYNGGKVLPAAINRFIYALVRLRDDKKIRMSSLQFPGILETTLDTIAHQTEIPWANYPLGVLSEWKKAGYPLDKGMDVLFMSTIPPGSGVSSSAAFEVVFGYALSDLFEVSLSRVDLALLCQRAENNFVGVSCGIMDQFAVAMGEKDKALLLDCQTLQYEKIPVHLGEYSLVLTNSNKKRELIDSAYNTRLKECREALSLLQQRFPIKELCELSESDLHSAEDLFQGKETLFKRALHAITENQRTLDAAKFLSSGDLHGFAQCLNASHDSLQHNYEVTGEHLDTLVSLARSVEGCLASRMTGAGFGGCTISLVKTSAIDRFKTIVGSGYKEKFGIVADFLVLSLEDGVKKKI